MTIFFTVFLIVLAAEMGDKTQLLTITLAARYRPAHVFTGIFIATLINHGFAVIVGKLISTVVPLDTIRIAAGLSFILFGLLALGTERQNTSSSLSKYGAVLTTTTAFFAAELGDKTQLAVVSFAAVNHPLLVLSASLPAMMVASSLSIFLGNILGHRIPESVFKYISAAVFSFFGLFMLWSVF